MKQIDQTEIITALKDIATSDRRMKAYHLSEFIHLYQRPNIEENPNEQVGGYNKWDIKYTFFLSCFGMNIHLFNYWGNELQFDNSHAEIVTKEIENVLAKIKAKYF